MSNLRDWFTKEITKLGFGGLEGIFDYLTTMSDAHVPEYLESMLGSEKSVKELSQTYLRRRANNGDPGRSSSNSSNPNEKASSDWKFASGGSKKGKRGKGKGRNAGPSTVKPKKPLYTAAVSGQDPARDSKASQAIRESPAEKTNQMVREYCKSKKPVNCIKCGKIECPIRGDGTCSFCNAAIFSIWDGAEVESSSNKNTQPASVSSVSRMLAGLKVREKDAPVHVFGRYVHRPKKGSNGYEINQQLKDLAGNLVSGGEDPEKEKGKKGQQQDFYRNPFISDDERKSWAQGLSRKLVQAEKNRGSNQALVPMVQGRVLVDNIESKSGNTH